MPRQRINDRETERRMLDAAIEIAQERGFQASLEGIVFDEVVRRAGVSRTSAYRRWPARELFYGDILVELAHGTALRGSEENVLHQLVPIIRERAASLTTHQDRQNLIVEILRISLHADYRVASTSPQWKAFHALLASHSGLADPELRARVGEALRTTLEDFNQKRARVYAQFAALFGYRLVPPLAGPDGFDFMSRAVGALFLGLIQSEATYDTNEAPRLMRPFGSSEQSEWIPAVYMLAGALLSYVEPDPHAQWDKTRVEDFIAAMESYLSTSAHSS